ncbi:MAG: SDR family oxidoreductase [Coriobacteriales bacterium]|jgi:NAD(P)-dependent dehydrogenase (short-subunit alcohol dehydrogenase family)|nr:SDR family oxidoreductase [Coriobacteriales bacterium]
MERLDGKRIIVIGGTSGMGETTVDGFRDLGAKVIFTGRNEEAGKTIATRSGAVFKRQDLAEHDTVKKIIDEAVFELGGLDSLFVVAALHPQPTPTENVPLDDFLRIMDANVTGTFLANQAAFPHLKEHGGSIVNFTSATGFTGYPYHASYAASKGAVASFVRTVAVEWGKYGIRVNMIAPAIWTPMYDRARAAMAPEQLAAHDANQKVNTPLKGRLGDPVEDYLPVAAFLASDSSGFMTGQTFSVDGGKLFMR